LHSLTLACYSSDERAALVAAIAVLARKEKMSEKDISWLFALRGNGKQGRGFWHQLAHALPSRSLIQVRNHAWTNLHPGWSLRDKGARWGEDEDLILQEAVEHGCNWEECGEILGRLPGTCRFRWLTLSGRGTTTTGAWAEAEVAALHAAVQAQLVAPPPAPKPGSGRALSARDNVNWAAVSAAMGGVRSACQCLDRYYRTEVPKMLEAGDWAKSDDQVLLAALHAAGVLEASALDWAALVPGRGARETLRRWKLMVKNVPGAVDAGFSGCVAFLHQRHVRGAPVAAAGGQGPVAAAPTAEEADEAPSVTRRSKKRRHTSAK